MPSRSKSATIARMASRSSSVIDGALHTDDVLVRAIEDLDMRELLANVDDQQALDDQIEPAVTQAVKDSLLDRLRSLV